MKELLIALADYNLKANERLGELLAGQSEAILGKDLGTYYKSIGATLEHIFLAEVSWLKRFNAFFSYQVLAESWLVTADLEAVKAKAASGPQALLGLLRDADHLLAAFTRDLREEDLSTRVQFKNRQGADLQRTYWNTIVHILNHGTHHRGEISAMLDIQGVANDYSGFNTYTS